MLFLLRRLIPLAVMVLAAWLVVRAVKGRPGSRPENPLEVLKVRYARGEISRAEFEKMKRELKN